MRSDEELARAVQDGDRAAASTLLARHQDSLIGLGIRWCRNREDAMEIAQETMVRALANIGDWDPSRRFAPWLYRIARNLAVDRLRRGGRTVPLPTDDDGPNPGLPKDERIEATEDTLHRAHVHQALHEAVAELPPLYRDALLQYHEEGLSYREMSRRSGEPEGTLMNRIFRGRKKLAEALRRRGIEP